MHWLDKTIEILEADTLDLRALALLGGGNPLDYYCGANLAAADVRGQDLRGMSFNGANVEGILVDRETKLDPSFWNIIEDSRGWPQGYASWFHRPFKVLLVFPQMVAAGTQSLAIALAAQCKKHDLKVLYVDTSISQAIKAQTTERLSTYNIPVSSSFVLSNTDIDGLLRQDKRWPYNLAVNLHDGAFSAGFDIVILEGNVSFDDILIQCLCASTHLVSLGISDSFRNLKSLRKYDYLFPFLQHIGSVTHIDFDEKNAELFRTISEEIATSWLNVRRSASAIR